MRRTVSQRMRPTSARRQPSATSGQFILSPGPEPAEPSDPVDNDSSRPRLGQAAIMLAAPETMPVVDRVGGEIDGLDTR